MNRPSFFQVLGTALGEMLEAFIWYLTNPRELGILILQLAYASFVLVILGLAVAFLWRLHEL